MGAEREALYSGLSHAAWGYFFLNFDFNLNGVSVLPRFVGFLLLLSACGKLSGARRDLALLRPLAALLSAWYALDWLLSWGGGAVGGHILFFDLLVGAAALYFHFQFLTDMAALAERYQAEGMGLDARLRRRRTVYVVISTAASLLGDLPAWLLGDWARWAVVGMSLVGVAAAVLIMAALFQLRKCL